MEPLGAINVTQKMFMLDEKLMKSDNVSSLLDSNQTISGWNSIHAPGQGTGVQLNAYLNQANIAAYWKNFGDLTLKQSNNFGVDPIGGPLRSMPEGSWTGNVLASNDISRPGFANQDGIYYPVRQPETVNNVVPKKNEFGIYMPNSNGCNMDFSWTYWENRS